MLESTPVLTFEGVRPASYNVRPAARRLPLNVPNSRTVQT